MTGQHVSVVERNFDLAGRMTKTELEAVRDALIVTVRQTPVGQIQDFGRHRNGLLACLASGDISGKEAGAAQFTGFAPTELEEAARRLPRGEAAAFLLYRYLWHLCPHTRSVPAFPIHLGIESTSICNLRCTMCFQSDPDFRSDKRNFGLMDFGLYCGMIDEGADKGLCSVKLSIRGEPLLHPQLPDMIAYARSKKLLDVMLNTNATLLTEERSRALLDAEPHLIVFSIDADSKQVFESIRVGAQFETVVGNVERFLKIRSKDYPNSITRARVQMTVVPESETEIQAVRRHWTGLADQVAIKRAVVRQADGDRPTPGTWGCRVLWQRMDVHYDGSVWLCDNDYHGKCQLGDLHQESLDSIWRSARMESLRVLHASGRRAQIPPCRSCTGL
jgi:radical SAM protein with 4Fe4S-binding SPASM domain